MAEIDCNGLDEPCVTWTGGVTRTGPRQYVLCGVDSETIFFSKSRYNVFAYVPYAHGISNRSEGVSQIMTCAEFVRLKVLCIGIGCGGVPRDPQQSLFGIYLLLLSGLDTLSRI